MCDLQKRKMAAAEAKAAAGKDGKDVKPAAEAKPASAGGDSKPAEAQQTSAATGKPVRKYRPLGDEDAGGALDQLLEDVRLLRPTHAHMPTLVWTRLHRRFMATVLAAEASAPASSDSKSSGGSGKDADADTPLGWEAAPFARRMRAVRGPSAAQVERVQSQLLTVLKRPAGFDPPHELPQVILQSFLIVIHCRVLC
jgi:hypothetical protein